MANQNGATAPYAHGECPEWQEGLQFAAKRGADQKLFVQLEGPCPRCGHDIIKDIRPLKSGAFVATGDPDSRPDSEEPRTYLITCNCVFGHENAPEGERGCGAQGAVTVKPNSGGAPLIEHAKGTAADWGKDEWIQRAEHEQLTRMRELAGQWTTMLGVITGFLAVGTIFDFTETDLDLSGVAWAAYVVLAGLALAAAVAAVYCGSMAAGLTYLNGIPADVQGRVQHVDAAVTSCSARLARSKRLALASVVALVIAMAVRVIA